MTINSRFNSPTVLKHTTTNGRWIIDCIVNPRTNNSSMSWVISVQVFKIIPGHKFNEYYGGCFVHERKPYGVWNNSTRDNLPKYVSTAAEYEARKVIALLRDGEE